MVQLSGHLADWWLGDAVGVVVRCASFNPLGKTTIHLGIKTRRFFEATTLLACLVIVSEVVLMIIISSIGHFRLGFCAFHCFFGRHSVLAHEKRPWLFL